MTFLLGGGGDAIPHRVGIAGRPARPVARKNNKKFLIFGIVYIFGAAPWSAYNLHGYFM